MSDSFPPYSLEPFRREDLLLVKEWRNAQLDILRQKEKLTDEEQKLYWEQHIFPSFSQQKPPILLFSYLKNGMAIGYGGLVHIDWEAKRAEVSFLLNPIYKEDSKEFKNAYSAFLKLIKQIAFSRFQLHRLFTETFDIRPHLVAILEEEGFSFEGRLKDHVFVRGHYTDSLIHGCVHKELK